MRCFICNKKFDDDQLEYKNGRYGVCMGCLKKERSSKSKREKKETTQKRESDKKDFVSSYKVQYGCTRCGYNKCARSLHFHHIDSKDKTNEICRLKSQRYGLKKIIEEMRKCTVLCSNCHGELHDGLWSLDDLPCH